MKEAAKNSNIQRKAKDKASKGASGGRQSILKHPGVRRGVLSSLAVGAGLAACIWPGVPTVLVFTTAIAVYIAELHIGEYRRRSRWQSAVRDGIPSRLHLPVDTDQPAEVLTTLAAHLVARENELAAELEARTMHFQQELMTVEDRAESMNDKLLVLEDGFHAGKSSRLKLADICSRGQEKIEEADPLLQAVQASVNRVSMALTSISGDFLHARQTARNLDRIAEDSDLLAINAAIEAARIGDAGRGFAVIASEMDRLAADSKNAGANIHQLLKTVLDRMDDLEREFSSLNRDTVILEENLTGLQRLLNCPAEDHRSAPVASDAATSDQAPGNGGMHPNDGDFGGF